VSTVKVQLFASYADMLGASTIELPVPSGTTVQELVERIRLLPGASRLPSTPKVALNRSFAAASTVIRPGDEIALIPPVAGG
jgi:molybdopterin converting factor subunit 1